MTRRISILGATGSIGQNTVDLIGRGDFQVVALTGRGNIAALARDARALRAEVAVTADPARLADLRAALEGSGVEAAAGQAALNEAAARPADWIMSAIVGAAGLAPTLAAARQGTVLALANKESLVCAGELLKSTCEAHGTTLLPVDSEHSAIFQCLQGERAADLERLILTASGGPFRDWSAEEMAAATLEQAVAHPNWDMGQRISIDSATMFNKALEIIEARQLFDVTPDQIEVVIHPQSIVHSMVGFADGAIMAQLGPSDMRGAIGYALNWPGRAACPVERLDFADLARLDFSRPDPGRFPALRLARRVLEIGGLAGAAFNAAKEAALDHFIAGRIGFLDMASTVEFVLEAMADATGAASSTEGLSAVRAVDAEARARLAARAATLR